MDGRRFDDLTRWAGSLPRRQVLRRGVGSLLGVVLAARTPRTQAASVCAGCLPNTVCCIEEHVCCFTLEECCDYQCCRHGLQCFRDTDPPRCAPCTSGIRCGSKCCVPGEECQNERCVISCPVGTTRCGSNCCASGQTCDNGQCVDCPANTTKCGANCCGSGQICDNGQCVDACPAGRAATGVAAQGCEPEKCKAGQVKCGDTCVPPCKGKLVRSLKSCKCVKKCPRGTEECGDFCYDPAAAVCCNGGFAPPGSTCCGKGHCDPGAQCCDGKACCPEGRRCCGEKCCPEDYACSRGRCCPFNTEACGDRCCKKGEICNTRYEQCCPLSHPYFCAKVKKCAPSPNDCPK